MEIGYRAMQVANPASGTASGVTPALNEKTKQAQPQNGWSGLCARKPWVPSLIIFAILVGVEVASFGASLKKTGFYLDDWLMLKQLTFGPQNYLDLIYTYLTTDPRVIIRPLEALHFGTVFFFSGADPLGWRLSNMVMEVLSAFFVYLIVTRMALSRSIGFFASLFFMTYPVHDSTHYWAVCSCVSFSLTFYLASLWATLKGASHAARANASTAMRNLWLGVAYLSFALSIYGYEPFLPLCALNAVAYVLISSGMKPILSSARKIVLHSIPYAAVIGSLLLYQRTIVPLILKAALHKIHFDPGLIAGTIVEGLRVSSPVGMTPFIASHVNSFVQSSDLNTGNTVRLFLLAVLVALGVLVSADVKRLSMKTSYGLLVLGLLTVAASYSIFGLNPEYKPTLITLVNRINTGAAFGLSIVFAGLLSLFLLWERRPAGEPGSHSVGRGTIALRLAFATVITGCLLVAFTITSWSLGKPWEISWSVQQRTFDAFRARKEEFKNVRNVVLMNCPRYVDATPVFDGPWDFEQQLHLALGRSDIAGGVVSERLIIGKDSAQDVTLGFACAEYPFNDLVLVTPGLTSVVKVHSAGEFIDVIEREGRQFGLQDSTIADWRSQVESGVRRKKNGVFAPIVNGTRKAGLK
jgi:hypothetical protein